MEAKGPEGSALPPPPHARRRAGAGNPGEGEERRKPTVVTTSLSLAWKIGETEAGGREKVGN